MVKFLKSFIDVLCRMPYVHNRHMYSNKALLMMTRNGMAATEISMSRLLKLAHKFNCFYLSDQQQGKCRPFIVEGYQVGLVRPDVMMQLMRYPDVFHIQPDSVELNPAFRDYDERSTKVEAVLRECRSNNVFVTLKGWREEVSQTEDVSLKENQFEYLVLIITSFKSVKLIVIIQFCTSHSSIVLRSAQSFPTDHCSRWIGLFGIRNYGVDINGYVMDPEKGLCIWLQRRSATKQTWPGKWDNMVGGGLSVGYGILETAIKEAAEEASIPTELIAKLRPAGCVSFFFESERGLFPNTEFVFDLELPADFVPSNSDGEVETFELLPANEALEKVFSSEFKTTSCPVVIDFLIRHGLISPETEPNFPRLVELLHVPLQSLYRYHQKQIPAENGQNSL
ncbi:hypothetical protein C0J52_04864 [Blattella germanica]|nr:hypothetical protein C0J52_04864 [Blattella germanica]